MAGWAYCATAIISVPVTLGWVLYKMVRLLLDGPTDRRLEHLRRTLPQLDAAPSCPGCRTFLPPQVAVCPRCHRADARLLGRYEAWLDANPRPRFRFHTWFWLLLALDAYGLRLYESTGGSDHTFGYIAALLVLVSLVWAEIVHVMICQDAWENDARQERQRIGLVPTRHGP